MARENPVDIEGPSGGDEGPSHGDEGTSDVAPEEDDGGPIDKIVLTSFKDHIAYAIWNREKVFYHNISYF